ncbi:MAG: ATP-binding cassette domain-containing protein [Jatrophihabitans sp.]
MTRPGIPAAINGGSHTHLPHPTGGIGRFRRTHELVSRVRIGRASDNDLIIDDLLVSDHHAELHTEPSGEVDVVDLASHNGTFVNGHRIKRRRLAQNDVVTVGRHQFHLVGRTLDEYVDHGEVTFSATGLSVVRDGKALLQKVSFDLAPRQFLAIAGPSGAGKSTLLKALNGFQPATKGSVSYCGRDLYSHYHELRGRIGYVPQDDILHLDLTVHEELFYGAKLRFPDDVSIDEQEARIAEVLAELGMTGQRDTPIKSLSGGERKRVSVALELLTKPTLLFLDEPTSGLDPGHERTLLELLRDLTRQGRSIVVVTHSVEGIRVSDQSLFLAPGGCLAYVGAPDVAPSYFARSDLQAVFLRLAEEQGEDWTQDFDNSALGHKREDDHVGAEPAAVAGGANGTVHDVPPRAQSWLGQTATLARRYTRILAKTNLPLLFLQAPILGALMLVALPAHELSPPAAGLVRVVSRAPLVLLVLVLASFWLGASNAVEEIVKELPILRRERAAGLSLSAYLCSKVGVLTALTLTQTAVLVPLALARQGLPVSASALGSPWLELLIVAALAGLSGMALGLLVSAVAGTLARAVTVLPVLLILEMLLAMGGIFPDVIDKPVLAQATYGASTSWGFAAAASTVDLNRLQALNNTTRDVRVQDLTQQPLLGQLGRPDPALERTLAGLLNPGDARFRHSSQVWLQDVGAMLALIALALIGAGVAVRRQTNPART